MTKRITISLIVAVIAALSLAMPGAANAKTTQVVGTWHCDIPGDNGPASSAIDYGFSASGNGWYASDKTGGTHEPLHYSYHAGVLSTWITPVQKSHYKVVSTKTGFQMIPLRLPSGQRFVTYCTRK